ncbi:MAG: hypothetical protein AAGC71_16025, partial [Pseudomonadota bacterium]
MAAESVRGKAIGPMLVKKALEDLPFNLSMGQTAQMRELQFALGWLLVGQVPEYALVTGTDFRLGKELPLGLGAIAARGLHFWHARLLAKAHARLQQSFSCNRLQTFSSQHDKLWEKMRESCRFAVIRDRRYLQWKYGDRPDSNLDCYEVRDASGQLSGLAVTRVRKASGVYPYSRGFITDLVVDLHDEQAVIALLVHAIDQCRQRGAQSVVVCGSNPELIRSLEMVGFVRRQSRYHFLIALPEDDSLDRAQMGRLENWFLTIGDSDADEYVS